MSDVEVLAVMRGVIALVGVSFAVRARMWLLASGWAWGVVASACLASGLSLVWAGIAGMPLYLFWGLHTLYVTRYRRTEPYLRRRTTTP